MRKFKIIGLTGPTGSGKTLIAEYFAKKGYTIINADKIARQVTSPHSVCLKTLAGAFGNEIINPDGSLDRKKLASLAFANKEQTQLLNDITHPFVYLEVFKKLRELSQIGVSRFIYDAPQLLESNGDMMCDFVISVICSKQIRIDRIKARDNINSKQALERINVQMPDEYYKKRSDFCIYNDSDLQSLYAKADEVLNIIEKQE